MTGGLPKQAALEGRRTHRLIPAQYSAPAVRDLVDSDDEFADLADLEGATNDRLRAYVDLLPGIDARELVYGVPYASIINAAFTHARPGGARFNSGERGAWYAAFEFETALAEVIFHHTRYLEEVGIFEDTSCRDEWLADFSGQFHDVRADGRFGDCLHPDPAIGHPAGQALARKLLSAESPGLIYPSVRNAGGTNIVCFRPPLVDNVQKGRTLRLIWDGSPMPRVER